MKSSVVIILFVMAASALQTGDKYQVLREKMVRDQIVSRGISDQLTLKAMQKVPRHLFVPAEYVSRAYNDSPLPIGHGQTISQPFIVAYMTEVVKPTSRKKALEIGTGSGYQAAVLAEIVKEVYSIEIVPELAKESAALLGKLGYENISCKYGDGYQGWKEHAPFDIIVVTAAAPEIPQPLIDQLAENGRLVIPVGPPSSIQELILVEKKNGKTVEKRLTLVRFVPFRRL
ncbi:MAG TPA: protein-L-isoaspartate(D-aspartate) O-methyltransferase [Bacteroidales bacterium]|jgi:protein-L-isoaspartate(D-aspartate) O-methyltransferase|nr:protein-L-isoaspartate(D-aspartate) O-methyltransferase [Bacteroidales bacterium]HQB86123.1 protein-L-isoaspartate(D-aspartate) O-methyltransferase [Bacteroidales bacterium]